MILSEIQKTESTYYTYTFNIKKEGAPEDALLENLVLSPLADGNKKTGQKSLQTLPEKISIKWVREIEYYK